MGSLGAGVVSGHRGCVTGAPVRLTNLECVDHVGVHPVVSSLESEQDDVVCSVREHTPVEHGSSVDATPVKPTLNQITNNTARDLGVSSHPKS